MANILSRRCCCSFLQRCIAKQRMFIVDKQHSTSSQDLWDMYKRNKEIVEAASPVPDMHPQAIYANYELSLSDIKVVGFDYDYTLASYTPDLHHTIFDLGKTALVNTLKYPVEILSLEFDPSFAVRGLHFDKQKGVLMKIDSFHYIQMDTVHKGLRKLPNAEVKAMYDGTHMSKDSLLPGGRMQHMIDLFAIPEMSLLALVIDYFERNNIVYDPEYLFHDIQNTIVTLHKSATVHQEIMKNIERFLVKTDVTRVLLERLRSEGKHLFLITNSGYPFANAGMRHLVGEEWMDLFDIVVVNARKPRFFNKGSRPFRQYDPRTETYSWGRVTELEKGQVYQEGNLFHLQEMTGWVGDQVLYFGDHVYSDLADPSLRFGWRTGAIVPELEKEIEECNKPVFKMTVRWLVVLQYMIDEQQLQSSPESCEVIKEWLKERDELRLFLKSKHNKYFGSLFRTHHTPTYFFGRLARYADIYMSSLTNLLYYPSHYTFYPHRMVLSHEPSPFYHTLFAKKPWEK